jgi:hypothetical protein
MTTSTFPCPHCDGQLAQVASYAGTTVACPHCGGHFRMPGIAPAPLPVAPPIATVSRKLPMSNRRPPAPPSPIVQRARAVRKRLSPTQWALIVVAVVGVGALIGGWAAMGEREIESIESAALDGSAPPSPKIQVALNPSKGERAAIIRWIKASNEDATVKGISIDGPRGWKHRIFKVKYQAQYGRGFEMTVKETLQM